MSSPYHFGVIDPAGLRKKHIDAPQIPEGWKMLIFKKFFSPGVFGWTLASILGVAVIVIVVWATNTVAKAEETMAILQQSKDELAARTDSMIDEFVLRHSDLMSQRDGYILKGTQLISEYYTTNRVARSRQLSTPDITLLLNIIFDYASQNIETDLNMLIVPLAFIATESNFVQSAKGEAGELGLFQFMPSTARLVSLEKGIEYAPGIEIDIESSVRLWFCHYSQLQLEFGLSRGVDRLKWIAAAYNGGADRRFLKSTYRSGESPDVFLNRRDVSNRSYPAKIVSHYERFSERLQLPAGPR
jgi:hypothetical protein